ncbi:molybdenum cofactor guanylyltransferase [Gluconacetobacter sp. 1c LMG 22058]|uniref:Molybdenum cofactor guanylyltransferase n=2 Tax=Gluconacetobacter dulcium TaxID=2729096 RepID=A0A7W4K2I3_9PROT|nr:molybdenum cofactor guanylyltransferase [Gluconacetobacter dulcium]
MSDLSSLSDNGTIVILAGGMGRRMGGCDKVLLPLGAGCVLDRLVASLRPSCARLALNANGDPARFARWGVPVLPDRDVGSGPLGGVLCAVDWARTQGAAWVLTVPGDTPFVPPDLMRCLTPAPRVAVAGGRMHPLVASWPVNCRDRLHAWLADAREAGDHRALRVRDFAASIGMQPVVFAEEDDPFFNINTPEDWRAACARAEA